MFFSTGYGFLVPVITFCCCLGMWFVVTIVTKNPEHYSQHMWPKIAAFCVAATLLWPVARLKALRRVEIRQPDPVTGERRVNYTGDGNTFIFFPMDYWSFPLIVLGIMFAMMSK